jgi:hypothetical protein
MITRTANKRSVDVYYVIRLNDTGYWADALIPMPLEDAVLYGDYDEAFWDMQNRPIGYKDKRIVKVTVTREVAPDPI